MDDGYRGLRLTNTLTRRKEELRPLDWADPAISDADRRVRMYVCGPTVYDYAHIGNARPVIVFDVLFRLLRHLYGTDHVAYVRNITDVDDKIIARAAAEHPDLPLNDAIRCVTEETERQFHDDVKALGCLEPSHEPRATEHIDRMRAMIERLVEKGNAYVAEEHVLFHVPSMPDYGRLSGRTLDEMVAGSRVEVAPYKRDPMDFVLWKPSKEGEPAWPPPKGVSTPGRPGWHIECSAMSEAFLGEVFDIHGGGVDLVFPHHENELAQSRCAHGTERMAQIWMHNGYLQVEGAKMSKSLGNFVTVRELLEDWPGEVIRLNMLKTHYRQPLDWTVRGLEESMRVWGRWLNFADVGPTAQIDQTVIDSLLDDLNSWEAIRRLDELAHGAADGNEQARERLVASARFLGLVESPESIRFHFPGFGFAADPAEELVKLLRPLPSSVTVGQLVNWMVKQDLTPSNGFPDVLKLLRPADPMMSLWELKKLVSNVGVINSKASARAEARRRKDWAEADRIRDELDAMGIALKDAKDPETGELTTTWELKR